MFGPIDIENKCGEGANSLVFSVEFNGPAAVKILAERYDEPPSNKLARFFDEYKGLLRLKGRKGIIQVFHIGILSLRSNLAVPYFIMERCFVLTISKPRQQ